MAWSPTDDAEIPRLTPAVQALIVINIAIYFLQMTVVQPQDMALALGFQMRDLGRSWYTIATYMFVHGGFWHLALNLYTLFLFGPRVERAMRSSWEFTRFYLVAGLGGLLAHVAFVRSGVLIGASAAVFGVMLAYAAKWPETEVQLFGVLPMRVRWLVAALMVMNLVQGLSPSAGDSTAYFAHVGGIVTAWAYLRATHALSPERARAQVASAPDLPDEPPRAVPRGMPRGREKLSEIDELIARKATAVKRTSAPVVKPKVTPVVSAELDHVLDKISQHGLESLNAEERRLLEEMSKRLREQ
ncbi:MAG: rhomboid family intramembrane serine protease [Gemmatimonadetes bacterium]|nr:rhomboid family intramembrane serine protease [Gemmatimonadota bacterium]